MKTVNNENRNEYLKTNALPLTTDSSILISSSKYLNSAKLRDVLAHEALRKDGWDLPTTYLLPELSRAINEVNSYEEDLRAVRDERARKPEFAAFLDERFFSQLTAETLKNYAQGTLGAEVYEYAIKTGMDIGFQHDGSEALDDLHYYTLRSPQCHDIEHIVTGLGPNTFGEIALVFFKATMDSNYFSPQVASINHRQILSANATFFIRIVLHYPHLVPGMLDAIQIGVAMAKRVEQQFLYVKWEDYWDWPLEDVRRHLNISGFPAKGAWDWSDESRRG